MTDSIHTVRWVNQINNQGWDIYIFPSYDNPKFHNELKSVIFLVPFYNLSNNLSQIGFGNFLYILKYFNRKFNKDYYIKRLSKYILKLKPDLIHTLETQGAGYLTAKALKLNNISIPWWHTNWGSDIYLFGRLVDHQIQIREVLEKCNFYSCECERDVALALNLGFNGHVFPVYPNTGGFDLTSLSEIKKDSLLTSNRKIIMLKGYQGWAGRALVGIRSLARCSDILKGYKIVIYANTDAVDIKIASALLSQSINIPVILLPNNTSHKEILTYHSKARISIGLSISDAISTSLLETMAMGSFPIQSCTACATEWIVNNVSGFIVPPEDPDIIESMIRKALSDDDLVNNAAKINFETITNKAEYNKLKELTIQSYKNILSEK